MVSFYLSAAFLSLSLHSHYNCSQQVTNSNRYQQVCRMWRWTAVLHDVWLQSMANCRWRLQHPLWLAANWHDRRLVDLLCGDLTWQTESGIWCIHTNTKSSHVDVLFSCSLWDKVLATVLLKVQAFWGVMGTRSDVSTVAYCTAVLMASWHVRFDM